MTAVTFKNDFHEWFAKGESERHHRYHQWEINKETEIFAEIIEQNEYDQKVIETGPRNGSSKTQHGVSAELKNTAEMNVDEIRDARTEGRTPNLVMKSEDTNGPHDMVRIISAEGRIEYIQAKYCKDPVRTLDSCIKHMKDNSKHYVKNPNGKYNIPKEQYDLIVAVKEGRVPEGTSAELVKAIEKRIERYEELKGDGVENIIPGVSYEDAQCENTEKVNQKRNEKIEKIHKEKEKEIDDTFSPSFKNSLKVGLQAGAVTGITTLVFNIGSGILNGKNILNGDYTADELLDEAIKAGRNATVACVVATATHYAETVIRHSGTCLLTIGKLVSAIGPLITAHEEGKITTEELKVGIYSMMLGLFANALVGLGISIVVSEIVIAVMGFAPTLPAIALGVLGAFIGMGLGYIVDKAYGYFTAAINKNVIKRQIKHIQLIAEIEAEYEKQYAEIRKTFAGSHELADRYRDSSLDVLERLQAHSDLNVHYEGLHTEVEYSFAKLKNDMFD